MNANLANKPIIFFDGYCGLCNWFVDFALARNQDQQLLFAPLQGKTAQTLIHATEIKKMESVVLYDNGQIYRQSDAILQTLRYLGGFWKVFTIFKLIPTSWRDNLYRFVAQYRYQWFGKRQTCRLPIPEEKQFFLP